MLLTLALSLLVSETPPPFLERLAGAAAEQGLVAIEVKDDCGECWCRRGKRPAASAIARLEAPGGLPTPLRDHGGARRVLVLREQGCGSLPFRLRVTELAYASEAEAEAAVRGAAARNHDGPELKKVHRLWRAGALVYFAESGAFTHWTRFRAVLGKVGVSRGACDHA